MLTSKWLFFYGCHGKESWEIQKNSSGKAHNSMNSARRVVVTHQLPTSTGKVLKPIHLPWATSTHSPIQGHIGFKANDCHENEWERQTWRDIGLVVACMPKISASIEFRRSATINYSTLGSLTISLSIFTYCGWCGILFIGKIEDILSTLLFHLV